MVQGKLQIKDQAREYIDRGDALESWSYLDYFLGTYDGFVLKEQHSQCGRNPSTRVPYREGTNRDGHCRIIRSAGHETMPYFPGEWFPKKVNEDHNGLFEAYMLALLKPWRSVTDLKHANQTFREAYDDFVANAPLETCRIIKNIQFYHECSERARERTGEETHDDQPVEVTVWTDVDAETMEDPFPEPAEDTELFDNLISDADIDRVLDQPYSPRDQLFADVAIAIGLDAGVLREDEYSGPYPRAADPATVYDLEQFKVWDEVLKNPEVEQMEPTLKATGVLPINAMLDINEEPATFPLVLESSEAVPQGLILNTRQTMAHAIVTSHLRAHLSQQNPPQRLVIVHGQGGTGKSALLNAISKTFDDFGASALLAKTAMSGVAASIIGGQTLHSWAALPIITPPTDQWLTHPGPEVKKRRNKNIENALWLTIDEMSMLTTPLVVLLSQAIGMVRSGSTSSDASMPFGGLSVVLLGDFHQLPPVAKAKKELYHPEPPIGTSQLGRSIYEQFDIVVKLDEQIRVQDQGWNEILQHARTGDCTKDDIANIRKLVLTSPECNIPNFTLPPWNETILVTLRNSVRTSWNEFMLTQHACRTTQNRYVVYAHDRTNDQPLTKQQRLAVAHLKLEDTNNLPHKIELVIGMKAMVMMNISTATDLANGSRGIVEDIILHPKERLELSGSSIIRLQYPPAVVLFRPLFCRDQKFPGLPKGIIPIFPTHKSFKLGGRSGIRINREQLALTPVYAFTDFKSQGQTIESVVVDLAKPPSGKITGFNTYVALSRSRGRDTIRLLRDFDEKMFTVHPNEHLRREDARLERLEKETQKRYDAGEFDFGNYHS